MKPTINPSKYTAHLHPGKFEGETAATCYFHEQMLNGEGETIYESNFIEIDENEDFVEDCRKADLFDVNADESEAFDLPIGAIFMIREDSQGFVYGFVHANRAEAEAKFKSWLGL